MVSAAIEAAGFGLLLAQFAPSAVLAQNCSGISGPGMAVTRCPPATAPRPVPAPAYTAPAPVYTPSAPGYGNNTSNRLNGLGNIINNSIQLMQPSEQAAPPTYSAPSYPHVHSTGTNTWAPDDGYVWINPSDNNDMSVRWSPGKTSVEYPHLLESDNEGRWLPADGYNWTAMPPSKSTPVRWTPGERSSSNADLVASSTEGRWVSTAASNASVHKQLGTIRMLMKNAQECLTDTRLMASDNEFDISIPPGDDPATWARSLDPPRWSINGVYATPVCTIPLKVTAQNQAFAECARVYLCALRTASCTVKTTIRNPESDGKQIASSCLAANPIPQTVVADEPPPRIVNGTSTDFSVARDLGRSGISGLNGGGGRAGGGLEPSTSAK